MNRNHLRTAGIAAVASYLPPRRVTNEELTQFPKATIPLIEQKTGVKSRHYASNGQSTSDLALEAASLCLQKAGADPLDIDAIVLSTSSPDRIQPATAARVQALLGARNAMAFDINAVCTGGLYALQVANAFIRAELYDNVLVVAAEVYSRFLNPRDFATCPYFGDGAGALLVRPEPRSDRGIFQTLLKTDGAGWDLIAIRAGGAMIPLHQITNPNDAYFSMRGKEVFEFAVTRGSEVIRQLLDSAGLAAEEVAAVVAHQANRNVLAAIADRTGIPISKFPIVLDRYGNTASASVFICLDEAVSTGHVRAGENVVLVAFGGGLTWGAMLVRL